MKLTTRCPYCKQTQDIEVTEEAYNKWRKGALIQVAFPELTADQREALMTGICGKCWDKLFKCD